MSGPELRVTDLDRTVLDTERAFSLFTITCADNGLDPQELESAKKLAERAGESFDPLTHLASTGLDQDSIAVLTEQFVRKGRGNLLYDDALPYFDALDKTGVAEVILTYGQNPAWQLAKLRVTRLDRRDYVITDKKRKGEVISSWGLDGGNVVVSDNGNAHFFSTSCLVDDKEVSFSGLPVRSRGFLLNRKPVKRRQLNLGPNITVVSSLLETI